MKTNIRLFTLLAVLTVTTHMYAATSANTIVPQNLPVLLTAIQNNPSDATTIVNSFIQSNQALPSVTQNALQSLADCVVKHLILPTQVQNILLDIQNKPLQAQTNVNTFIEQNKTLSEDAKTALTKFATAVSSATSGGSTRPVNSGTTAIK
ncbi:hypothetical protein EBR77_01665 [bacterium]|nr:hypothetical protein [bacterium]NBX78752.1 hypothetical protein [bacterium]